MTTFVSILRGINVGGKRKLLMADLKDLYEALAYTHVQTYIQSGNVVFDYQGSDTIPAIAKKIQQNIHAKYGYVVPVIVRKAAEITSLKMNNPYIKAGISDSERFHVTFLQDTPKDSLVDKLNTMKFPPDQFSLIGKHVYLFCAGKSSDSRLTNQLFERTLKVAATTRNWKTVCQLAQLCEGR